MIERQHQFEAVRIGGRVWYSARGSVVLSDCELYRYHLSRWWGPADQPILWVMLNPSTADERQLDPTVRRCVEYAHSWGFNAVHVCNLFALRASDPKALYASPAPEGPQNDEVLARWSRTVTEANGLQIAAWGVHGALRGQGPRVAKLLAGYGDLSCLTLTKDHHPGHPLYLRKDLRPFWVPPSLLNPQDSPPGE